MGGSTLPVGMVWNYIGGIGIELDRCSQRAKGIRELRAFGEPLTMSKWQIIRHFGAQELILCRVPW
jgi:hypothetical protein